MTHQKLKKIFFGISLIPYFIFFLLGFVNCIIESIQSSYLDLYAFIHPIADFWIDVILFSKNIFSILFIFFFIGYPIYYLIDIYSQKKYNFQDVSIENNKKSISYIIYLLSFIPYLYLIYVCIFGIEFGIFTTGSTYYGFKAIILAFCLFSIIPIYPTILIFQIIYTLKKYKTFDKKRKKTIKSIILFIIILLIIPSIFYLAYEKHELNTTLLADKLVIEEYLINTFGEEHYKNMEIIEPDRICTFYTIKTPLVNYAFDIYLNESRTEIESSTFIDDFCQKNNLYQKMDYYLTSKFNLPDNIEINSSITNINLDMKNYDPNDNAEKLLSQCEFSIESFYIYIDVFNKDEIINLIKNYFVKYHNTLQPYYSHDWIRFHIKLNSNDDYFAEITIYNTSKISDKLCLHFRGYTDSYGIKTIENFKEYIDLNN